MRAFLLQDLDLALQDVSFVGEMLLQILVSAEKRHVKFLQMSAANTGMEEKNGKYL